MHSFLFPLIFTLLGAGGMAIICNVKIERTIPVFYIICIFFLYVSGITGLGLLPGGILIGMGISVVIICAGIKCWKGFLWKDNLVTYGMFAFLIIYALVYVLDFKRGFNGWDEMSHWGPMVKEMVRLDNLYSIPESKLLVHKDYPPAIALFEALWCKICGGYEEKFLYRSLHTMAFSMLLPVLDMMDTIKKKWQWKVLNTIFIIWGIILACLPFDLADGNFFTTIYVDGIVGIIFASCMFQIFLNRNRKFDIFSLTAMLSFLVITKQVGIEYYLICLLFVLMIDFVHIFIKKEKIKIIAQHIPYIIFPMIIKMSWSLYTNSMGLQGQFRSSKFDFQSLLEIINGTDKATWRYQGTQVYINALFSKPLVAFGNYGLTYAQLLLTFFIVLGFLVCISWKTVQRVKMILLTICIMAGAVGHLIMMWLLYLFGYNERDCLMLICYDRYMNIYWHGTFILIVLIILTSLGSELARSKKRVLQAVLGIGFISLCVICILNKNIELLKPAISNNSSLRKYYKESEQIEKYTEDESRIYFISQGYTGYYVYVFHYLTLPREYNVSAYSLGEPYEDGDNWTYNVGQKEILDLLKGYDYLYFFHVDEQFEVLYGDALCGIPDDGYKDGMLYKLIEDKKITCEPIADLSIVK